MAVVELQFREQAFSELIIREVNSRRLQAPTLDGGPVGPDNPLLDSVTAIACELVQDDAGALTARVDLTVRSYENLAVAKAAGSLQQPPTLERPQRIPISIKIGIEQPPPNSSEPAKAKLSYSSLFLKKGGSIDLGALAEVGAKAGFIKLQGSTPDAPGIVAIRIATDSADTLDGPVVDRIPPVADWTLVSPGSLIADQFVAGLAAAVDDVVKPDPTVYGHGALASGGYGIPPFLGVPAVTASAVIVAIDACPVFNVDIDVELHLVATFTTNGPNLDVTLRLTWDAHSAWCQFADFFVLTPFAPFVIAHVATQQANEAILGKAKAFSGFKEIARDDHSVTFLQHRFLDVPSLLVVQASHFDEIGLVVSGGLAPLQSGQALHGWSVPATSSLDVDCGARRVSIAFNGAQVGLVDFTRTGGAPVLFAQETSFDPPGAWVAVPVRSNDALELLVEFADPPTGRLPAGTATSAYVMTDCGLRWVDLGVIPVDHASPTLGDVTEMISHCMAKSAGWKERVLSVRWLPRPVGDLRDRPAIRQWMLGWESLPRSVRLEFVAVNRDGAERSLGAVEGRSSVTMQVTTDGDESLEIRANQDELPLPSVSAQRWIAPLAMLRSDASPVAVATSGGRLVMRDAAGAAMLLDVGDDGGLHASALEASSLPTGTVTALSTALDRAQRQREAWNSVSSVDRATVAVVHKGALLVGRAGELQVL